MGWLHDHKPVEAIIDPACQQLSMSRICLPLTLGMDLFWVAAVVMNWPPKEALAPVSSMLGVITGAVCTIYSLSTVKGGGIAERVKTAFQKGGPVG